jgi:hypothetical protein
MASPRPIATPSQPAPNYDERDGDTYLYASAVSEEDQKKGKAVGSVLLFRYLGVRDGIHNLASVDNSGRVLARYQCSTPCRIIKRDLAGETDRIPYSPASVIGAVFEDAINGNLKEAAGPSTRARRDDAEAARIPVRFVGEWNADLSACGTGLSDTRLRIEPRRIRFYESDAEVRSVTILNERSIKVAASFAGEGQTWTDEVTFVLSRSGNDLSSGDLTRHRCRV